MIKFIKAKEGQLPADLVTISTADFSRCLSSMAVALAVRIRSKSKCAGFAEVLTYKPNWVNQAHFLGTKFKQRSPKSTEALKRMLDHSFHKDLIEISEISLGLY